MNTISFTLETDSKIRLYHQLYEKIAELIKNGSYPKNTKLPSIRTISEKLYVSKNTVTKAYELLEKNHFIYSEQKRGYFVMDLSKSVPIQTAPEPEKTPQPDDDIPTVESIIRQRMKNQEDGVPEPSDADEKPKPKKSAKKTADYNPKPKKTKSVTIQKATDSVPIKQNQEPAKPSSVEERLAECYRSVLLQQTAKLQEEANPFGELCLKKAIVKFLNSCLGIKCDENLVVIGSSKDSLLSAILQLQSLNTPYIKSQGVGLLRLANQFTTGSLTTVKAIAAVAEDTDLPTKKIFAAAGLPVKEVPVNEFGLDSNFVITSGATSVFTIPGDSPEFSVSDPKEHYKIILDWASQASYRYIIEYDTENSSVQDLLTRFKSLDSMDTVIYINSFENLLPLGLKTSFAVLPKNIFADFQQKYDNLTCPVSLLEQLVLTEFIDKNYLSDYLS